MNTIYLIIFFILGLHMGSFYTVIGLRLPKHQDFIKTRSHCDHCKHTLGVWDMVPVFSYLFLKGRCRYCHKKFSGLSSYMEIFSGLLYALSFFVFGFTGNLFIALGIISMLIILSVSDITYYIIPDEILIFFSGYFIILNTIMKGIVPSLLSILSGLVLFGFMYLVMLIGNFLFKKETLGGGDIKLMFVVGLVLNPFLGLVSIFLASFLALPVSLLIMVTQKKNMVPFGPFLISSCLIVFCLTEPLSNLFKMLYL